MASQQTLEALATWARTFDGSENATLTTLSKDLATAFSTISEARTPQLLRRLKRWYAQELSRDVSSLIDEASDDVVKQASLVLGAAVQGSATRAPHHHYYGTGRHGTIGTYDFSTRYHAYDGPSAVVFRGRCA